MRTNWRAYQYIPD